MNKKLSLEELKHMDGKPAYLKVFSETFPLCYHDGWVIIGCKDNENVFAVNVDGTLYLNINYGIDLVVFESEC